jgi:hypothetical protein
MSHLKLTIKISHSKHFVLHIYHVIQQKCYFVDYFSELITPFLELKDMDEYMYVYTTNKFA